MAVQTEKAQEHASKRGWPVVAVFSDDGVSASKYTPSERKGWQAMQAAAPDWDVVVAWKLDRVTRSMPDLWRVHEWLTDNGKRIETVEDTFDMTTVDGMMMATILAGHGQKFVQDLSRRVTAARQKLIDERRQPGGTVPYGWRNVDNPEGPGKVLRHDPQRIEWVRGMVERVQRGDTLYSIKRWLEDSGAPLPTGSQKNRKSAEWRYTTIERLLRHPVLAGAVPYNPGNRSKQRGVGILFGKDGLPYINESAAIMSLAEWRAMVKKLDERDSPQTRPRSSKTRTSGLLAGLIFCGDPRHDEPVKMHRGTTQGRESYQCRQCYQTISNFEDALISEFLLQKGDWVRWSQVEEVQESGADDLPLIEEGLAELSAQINRAATPEERAELWAKQQALFDLRDEKRQQPGRTVEVWNATDDYFSELWVAAGDDEVERRAVLQDALERVLVRRGRPGRRKAGEALERLEIAWKRPEELGPRPSEG